MNTLTDKELELIFAHKKPKKERSKLSLYLLYILFAAILYLFFYFVANFPALLQKISWWYKNDLGTNNQTNTQIVTTTNNGTPIVDNSIANISDNTLYVPKIDVKVPILWNIENQDAATQKGMESGVVHLAGTALPGAKGNGFITGHSSNYLWAKGSYKTVFSLLNKLVIGDQMMVKYQNNQYVYRINKIVTIRPDENQILKQALDKKELSLMTCVPVGTSLYRLVITGEQIYPKALK